MYYCRRPTGLFFVGDLSHRENKPSSFCPVVPVEAHGRLIDGDRLARYLWNKYGETPWVNSAVLDRFIAEIKAAPTVVPAIPEMEIE